MRSRNGFLALFAVILFLAFVWTSRFGLNFLSSEGYAPILREDAWLLVCLGLAATGSALLLLFIDFRLSRSAAFIGWVFYFPVIFNVLVPMFVLFFSVVGVFLHSLARFC